MKLVKKKRNKIVKGFGSTKPNREQYIKFIKTVFKTISDGNSYRDKVYSLFRNNLEIINSELPKHIHYCIGVFLHEGFREELLLRIINDFGILLNTFPSKNRAININIAIDVYNITLQKSFAKVNCYESNLIRLHLASFYSEKNGNSSENIELAIRLCNQSLEKCSKKTYFNIWKTANNNLACLYVQRIQGDKSANVKRAIEICHSLLSNIDFKADSYIWACAQMNLGNSYIQKTLGSKSKNIELAIEACKKASMIFTIEMYPYYYIGTKINLAFCYLERVVGDKTENIELAIQIYKQSLKICTINEYPSRWATIQHNLGCAYSHRIKGDKAENIELAIDNFRAAFKIRKREIYPYDWATNQSNLGFAYLYRTVGERAENIELAIHALKSALEIRTLKNYSYKYGRTQLNLGCAYLWRQKGNKTKNIELAIETFELACKAYCIESYPQDWATAINNLGNAYLKRIEGYKHENLDKAISLFKSGFKVYTRKAYPYDWAANKHNLGVAYSDRIDGNREENIKIGIAYYKDALTVYTPKEEPIRCFATAYNLGDFAFIENNWGLSIDSYSTAIEAVEQSREWASNDDRKQEIISNAIAVYQNIVQACINLGQIDKAIEYVERGKARNLVDLLATRDLYPKGDIPQEVIDRLDDLRKEAIAEEKRLSQQRDRRNGLGGFSMGDNRGLESVVGNDEALNRDRLNQIRQELDNLVKEHIQPVNPSFQLTQKVEPISFEKIKEALPTEQTALIEWFIGHDKLSAFIVTRQQEIPFHLDYTEKQFQALVDVVNQYYDSYRERDRQWHSSLPSLLTQLAQHLQIEIIIERIKQLIPDCDRLIIVPHRWLHLLPIHALPLADGQCLLDLFPQGVSYAPSVQLLELTQKQSKPELHNLFAVQNPTEDLNFTDVEVKAVRSQFQPNDDVLTKQQAIKSALNKERLGQANAAHFSCHGYFNFENPELSALLLAGSTVEKNQEGENKSKTRFLPSRDGGSIDLEHCLTLGEIFSLDLRNCRLVTLSACETGITDFRSLSDEYIGLPSGFLYAGSPSVVSSLWAVNDLSTSFLMIKFYQNLQEIDSVPVALNKAQLWLRSATKEELYSWGESLPLPIYEKRPYLDSALRKLPPNSVPYASPFYWAAFCAVGK